MVWPENSHNAKISSNSPGSKDHLIRKRSPLRIRAWARNFQHNICLHLLGDFLSQEMRTEMLCRHSLVPQVAGVGRSGGH